MHFGCVCLLVVIIYSFLLRERSFLALEKSLISKESVKHTLLGGPKKKKKLEKVFLTNSEFQSR
jgi:hypothetical protein